MDFFGHNAYAAIRQSHGIAILFFNIQASQYFAGRAILHKLRKIFLISNINIMALRLGDDAPNFKAATTVGEIDFHEYLGNSWGILYSHPADYTPVCTTELGRTARLKDEFAKRNVKVLAVSVDSLEHHMDWVKDIDETQHTVVDFPIIADDSRTVAALYDMIHPNASATATVRSLFIIGPDKKVKLMITYPASTGRNFTEILRVVDSLQLAANYSVATPADWKNGEDVIVALTVSTEDALKKFPKGVTVVKPYLRYTPQPDLD
jgi:thioredoxin-dependent peroxiredoxin